MKYPTLRIGLLTLGLAFLATPLVIVFGAGGRIEGKVTDPKAAIVVGATIRVICRKRPSAPLFASITTCWR